MNLTVNTHLFIVRNSIRNLLSAFTFILVDCSSFDRAL